MADNIYFLSDFHLGIPSYQESLQREKKIVMFLDSIKNNAKEIIILGDMFDFWFEYTHVVPKGFVRILSKFIELKELNIKIKCFVGNHDLWMDDYLTKECGVEIVRQPEMVEYGEKKFLLGHGDGLGGKQWGYRFIKKLYLNPILHFIFKRIIHPDWGILIATATSKRSRQRQLKKEEKFLGEDKEWLIQYCKKKLLTQHIDYFIFGHRHTPIIYPISNTPSAYCNTGDWVKHFSYIVYNISTQHIQLLKYE